MIWGIQKLLQICMAQAQGRSLLQVLSLSESSTRRGQLWPSALESVPRNATQSITVWGEEAISLKMHHVSVGILLRLTGTAMEPTKDIVPPGI
uniref:Uncharacterized protein n=1 Tax=Anguilla anguilla TaxID=7936 RepID=A0A0E9XXN5_ANGAN